MDLQPILEQLAKLPPEALMKIMPELKVEVPKANPSGAVLIGVFLARSLGIGKIIDDFIDEEYVTYEHLREERSNGSNCRVSTGLACEIMIGDMLGRNKDLTRLYKFEEACENWQVETILGIPAKKFNDDKMGRALDTLNSNAKYMANVLQDVVLSASKRFDIPLNTFYNDTSSVPVYGDMENNDKVQYGYGGMPGLKQLILNLTISAGASLPVTSTIDPGNVQGGNTFERSFEKVKEITDGQEFEMIIDRGILTQDNMHLMLTNSNKKALFIGPLKDELSKNWVLEQLDNTEKDDFVSIEYRSKKEIERNLTKHYVAFETEYTFKVEIDPLSKDKKDKKRRKKGERKFVIHTIRAIIYCDLNKKPKEEERRQKRITSTEDALVELNSKLNKRNLITKEACEKAVDNIFKGQPEMRRLFNVEIGLNQHDALVMSWSKDEAIIPELEKTDGIFVLLTNHDKEKVDANELLTRYRSRNDIEISFRFLKGSLDLQQVFLRNPERVDAYCFLKVLAMLVINLAAWLLARNYKKMSTQKLQKELGDLTISEQRLQPIGVRHWNGTNIPNSIDVLVNLFNLPHPLELIEIINSSINFSYYIEKWFNDNLKK
ncbi:transposase IS4 family protein [Desulfofarcimen acetoxidans DSM 771]|uniref:Transposase IS4 family protein n=1 Tax=Desulfofarcimen acetoxidans (strain ATCC 49208 / DSM 771 / KCTC 5769 / VKM B-1644 / 5575) TaxID=485916 RepID=C8W4X6_DESAS|nr:IS1634 family transposase [Desulfofarcimen acetoxidans]ACV61328.1 transposase IS4 family protein [Desulfofarcimen acetoxidans DSM 771]